jgi:hypothetical protein
MTIICCMHSNIKFAIDFVNNFMYNIKMVHNNTCLKQSNNNKNKENFYVNV